jgi:hypothetical protein
MGGLLSCIFIIRGDTSDLEHNIPLDDYRQRWVTWIYSGIPSPIIGFGNETNFLSLFF